MHVSELQRVAKSNCAERHQAVKQTFIANIHFHIQYIPIQYPTIKQSKISMQTMFKQTPKQQRSPKYITNILNHTQYTRECNHHSSQHPPKHQTNTQTPITQQTNPYTQTRDKSMPNTANKRRENNTYYTPNHPDIRPNQWPLSTQSPNHQTLVAKTPKGTPD